MGVFVHLGNFLARLFGKNADLLIGMFSKKIALTASMLAIIVSMFAVLYSAVTGILNSISYIMPNFLVIASSWVVPDNINQLVTSYIAFRVALSLYRWKSHQLQFISKGI